MSLCFPIATGHIRLLDNEPVVPRKQMEHFHFVLRELKCTFAWTFGIYGY